MKLNLLLLTLALGSATSASAAPDSRTSTGDPVSRGKAFNPDIGVNFLGLLRDSSRGSDPSSAFADGFAFQEAELQFAADVDPYLRAVATFAIEQADGEYEIGPEETYLDTISLPVVSFRLGKFYAAFGRHNLLHTHAFPFIDRPVILEQAFGEEGLNELGVSGSVLLPTPWFLEITAQGFSGTNTSLFGSANASDYSGVAHLKNLWDLSETSTLELGASGLTGANSFDAQTQGWGADLTFKWRPTESGKYHSLAWSTEYLSVNRESDPAGERLGGIASWIQYQFAQRWWVQARAEFVGIPKEADASFTQKQSALLGFFPSEFSGFRLQFDHLKVSSDENPEYRVALQWNVSIGAHPAHHY